MLKRQDFVNNILDMFDDIDALKMENEHLKNATPKIKTQEKALTFIDVLMIKKGKEEVFKYATYSWNKVDCNYDEESDTYSFTSYDKWLIRKIQREKIPNSMSLYDFTTYFKSELLEMYKKEKEESLKEEKENR